MEHQEENENSMAYSYNEYMQTAMKANEPDQHV